jgi:L-fuconolactonase
VEACRKKGKLTICHRPSISQAIDFQIVTKFCDGKESHSNAFCEKLMLDTCIQRLFRTQISSSCQRQISHTKSDTMKMKGMHFSRRGFLRKGMLAAGVIGLGPAFCSSAEPRPGQPIIDAHIHLYDPTRPGGVRWPPRDNAVLYAPHLPKQFRTATAGVNIVGTIVIEANAWPEDNRWVLDLARTEPLIIAYIGRLNPGHAGFAANFDQYVKNPIFRGLRLSAEMLAVGIGTKLFDSDLQRLAEHKLSLDLVGGPDVLPYVSRVEKIAPGLPMVIDHLPFAPAGRATLRAAAALPNVFAKISDVLRRVDGKLVTDPGYYRPPLDLLWELFGEERVIYGSNWPVSDVIGSYQDVFKVVADYANDRGRAAAGKFFLKNSLAAYQTKLRGV